MLSQPSYILKTPAIVNLILHIITSWEPLSSWQEWLLLQTQQDKYRLPRIQLVIPHPLYSVFDLRQSSPSVINDQWSRTLCSFRNHCFFLYGEKCLLNTFSKFVFDKKTQWRSSWIMRTVNDLVTFVREAPLLISSSRDFTEKVTKTTTTTTTSSSINQWTCHILCPRDPSFEVGNRLSIIASLFSLQVSHQ